jgi:hypothetical protein
MFEGLTTAWRRFRGTYPKEYDGNRETAELGQRAAGFHTTLTDYTVWKATREGVAKCVLPKGTKYYAAYWSNVWPNGEMRVGVKKHRAEVLYVEKVYDYNGVSLFDSVTSTHTSLHDDSFSYTEGRHIRPSNGFSKMSKACAGGIHFFATKKEALAWHRDCADY